MREAGGTRGLFTADRRLTAVVPTSDPAATIATRTAGLIEFSATLSWDRSEDVVPVPTLQALPEIARWSLVETDEPAEHRREILGEILALSEDDLGSALESVLRSLAITASLSDAVLETRAARGMPPGSAPATTLQALALDLWDAGFQVRFAPSWTPVPRGTVGLGVRGAEKALERFLKVHPTWKVGSHRTFPTVLGLALQGGTP